MFSGGQRVDVVATGALTNIAVLFIMYPEVLSMVEVTIMGGALGLGNTGAVMEFNIQVTPSGSVVKFCCTIVGPLCPYGYFACSVSQVTLYFGT